MNKYDIIKTLGKVNESGVFLAIDKVSKTKVALKIFSNPSKQQQAKLLHDATILKTLHHPNIVRVLDAGLDEEGNVFYAMEFLDGRPLYELIPIETGLSFKDSWPLIQGILSGVQALHQAHVLHLDIKPGNILIVDNTPKLIDIGMLIPQERGKFRGTPGYVAPEIILGQQPTTQSDIYSLGALCAYIWSGHKLFKGDSSEDTLAQQLKTFSESKTLAGLSRVIQRATKHDPHKRYPGVIDMVKAISITEHEKEFRAEEPSEDPAQTKWGHWVVGSILATLLSIAFGIYYVLLTSV
jgi:serine/threonine-protein kinase